MRRPTLSKIAFLWCIVPTTLLLGTSLATLRVPYLPRLTAASGLMAIIALMFLGRRRKGTNRPRPSRQAAVLIYAVCVATGIGIWLLLSFIELSSYFGYPVIPSPVTYPASSLRLLGLLAAVALLAPFAAETLFRGLILPACAPFGRPTALALSSLCFGVYSLGFFRFYGLLPVLLLGFVLGSVAQQTQSLAASTLAHGVTNSLTIGVFLVNGWRPEWVAGLPLASSWSGIIGAAVTTVALWLLARLTPGVQEAADWAPSRPRWTRVRRVGLIGLLLGAAFWTGPTAPPADLVVPQLTPQQKEAEFLYLTGLVRETYTPSESVVQVKGLPSLVALEDDYIRRAAQSGSNWEYYQIFREYFARLSHGGHANLMTREDADYYSTWYLAYNYGLYPAMLPRVAYWSDMEDLLDSTWYAHSSQDILYQDGNYVLASPAVIGGRELPAGTRITGVQGLSSDDYVRQQQSRERLQYDPVYDKLFLRWANERLLVVSPGPQQAGWQVEFQLPDGSHFVGVVPAIPGHNWAPYNQPQPNVIAVELGEAVGYLRVYSFMFSPDDHALIQDFMQASGARFKKLIVDVRGNGGGDPRYWMDSLVAPLLRGPLTYHVLTAVRRGMFERLHIRFVLQRLGGYGMFAANEHFGGLAEVTPPIGYDPRQWRAFKMTRHIYPADTFPFDGQVYVLVDDVCASACEDFALAVKTTGIARLIGGQTFGTAPGVFPPMPYTLPESGISFLLEANLVFNPDGTVNQIYGTAPDVRLSAAVAPTANDRDSLLADPWIQWVLKDQSELGPDEVPTR